MIRGTTRLSRGLHLSTSSLVTSSRLPSAHSRIPPFRPYSREALSFTHDVLSSLSRDELIKTCMEVKMIGMENIVQLVREKELVMKEKDVVMQEKEGVMREKEGVMREKEGVMREKDDVRQELMQTIQAKCVVDLELREYFDRYKALRMQYLRQEDQFNLRGIIEYIASTNPSKLYGTQSNLNELGKSEAFQISLQVVLTRLKLPKDGVMRSYKQIYSVLSKHFHQHNLGGNTSDLVIDTTSSNAQVFNVLDGAALEGLLQLALIPYVAISRERAIRYTIVGPGRLMVGEELPSNYQRQSWLDRLGSVLPRRKYLSGEIGVRA